MPLSFRRRAAVVIIPGLCAGGACGAGVGLGLYPAAVGIAGAVGDELYSAKEGAWSFGGCGGFMKAMAQFVANRCHTPRSA